MLTLKIPGYIEFSDGMYIFRRTVDLIDDIYAVEIPLWRWFALVLVERITLWEQRYLQKLRDGQIQP